jgi:ABC-type Na+ efflux pump permease subunit
MSEGKEKMGGGEETAIERVFNVYVGNAIHIFLSVLALLVLVAAAIGAFDTVVRDFPKLLQPSDEYKVLQQIVENILLVAIAAELGLLLLFHRTSAAIEVIIFVIARKIVSPGITALELLFSVAALAGLLVVRFYYLPGRPK